MPMNVPIINETHDHDHFHGTLDPAILTESHLVTLQGVVSDLEVQPPLQTPGKCRIVYGEATFTLVDGTDSLLVEMQGNCGRPLPDGVLPQNGDMVRLTAHIHLLNRDLPGRLRAMATTITILDLK